MRHFILPAAALVLCACARVDGTGRSQLMMTTPAEENRMGAAAYAEILASEPRCTDPAVIAFVERVGKRLAPMAPDKGFQYEFTVLQSSAVNAFCLPGGKVAVYTGILPYCANEAGLAAVMGHEIAHAIARHGGERMSQGQLSELIGGGLQQALATANVTPTNANLFVTAYGAGVKLGAILPYSRAHELEADRLGLMYMARAGYDPHEAVAFWTRFAALGSGTPSFLSTHPASTDRAAALQALMPEALALYHAATLRHGAGEAVPAAYRVKP
jgi:predicted Zn-dependent protease